MLAYTSKYSECINSSSGFLLKKSWYGVLCLGQNFEKQGVNLGRILLLGKHALITARFQIDPNLSWFLNFS